MNRAPLKRAFCRLLATRSSAFHPAGAQGMLAARAPRKPRR